MNQKISFYTAPYPEMTSYKQIIDLASEKGLSAIEGFCNFEFSEPDRNLAKEIRAYAESKGIVFSCFSLFCDVSGEDAKENIARLCQYADIAAIVGSPFLHHTIANNFWDPQGTLANQETFFKQGIQSVREVYDYAASLGLRTIYEDQGFIFNGVVGFQRFLDAVDRNVGAVADFGNIAQVEEGVEDFIRAFPKHVVHVHVKDLIPVRKEEIGPGCLETVNGNWVREVEIGTGTVKIQESIDLLKASGYNGYYSIEYQGTCDGDPSVDRVLSRLDSWLR